jgi:hypothetical protein
MAMLHFLNRQPKHLLLLHSLPTLYHRIISSINIYEGEHVSLKNARTCLDFGISSGLLNSGHPEGVPHLRQQICTIFRVLRTQGVTLTMMLSRI